MLILILILIYYNQTGKWSGIGTINFTEAKTAGNTSLDGTTIQLATPLFPNLKTYPLVNEYVLIVQGPSNQNPDIGVTIKEFLCKYYFIME